MPISRTTAIMPNWVVQTLSVTNSRLQASSSKQQAQAAATAAAGIVTSLLQILITVSETDYIVSGRG